MPLHNWRDERGWDSVQHFWITRLAQWLKPRLPSGFRAYLGVPRGLTIRTESGRPDVSIRHWQREAAPAANPTATAELATPDFQGVARATADPQLAVQIVRQGELLAAIELVSPRNKDRAVSKDHYTSRYLGYLTEGVNLLLVDVLPRPAKFSFADEVAAGLEYPQPALPAPHAVSWSVSGPLPEGGRYIETWHRPLTVGSPLPAILLELTAEERILIDLEPTYAQAAADAYRE